MRGWLTQWPGSIACRPQRTRTSWRCLDGPVRKKKIKYSRYLWAARDIIIYFRIGSVKKTTPLSVSLVSPRTRDLRFLSKCWFRWRACVFPLHPCGSFGAPSRLAGPLTLCGRTCALHQMHLNGSTGKQNSKILCQVRRGLTCAQDFANSVKVSEFSLSFANEIRLSCSSYANSKSGVSKHLLDYIVSLLLDCKKSSFN